MLSHNTDADYLKVKSVFLFLADRSCILLHALYCNYEYFSQALKSYEIVRERLKG
jgi:hypothetical protein